MKIVVAEKVSKKAVEMLRAESAWQIVETEPAKEKLIPELKDAVGLIIRSAVQVTAELLEHAPKLQVIGRAGIGVDNVDIEAATKKGVIVMNTPGGNAVSVAEHTLALMLSMARGVPQANESMHAGKWEKKIFEGRELRGKILGLIGLGRIGIEVVKRAKAFEMETIAFDPYVPAMVARDLNVATVSLDELLQKSDYITLHSPATPETANIINKASLAKAKKGVRIVNCARGELIDEAALAEALASGHVAGAALDVFAVEPPKGSPLLAVPQAVLTPHIAGSTAEAQEIVGIRIAEQVREYLKHSVIQNAVNVPSLSAEEYSAMSPYLLLAERLGMFLTQVSTGAATRVTIQYSGKLAQMNTNLVRNSALKGLLNPVLAEKTNIVNALTIAEERGIRIEETRSQRTQFADTIHVTLQTNGQESSVEGMVLHGSRPRLLALNGINVESPLEGHLVVTQNQDVPGVIGQIGTILGKNSINIADFSLGRENAGGGKSGKPAKALAVVHIDEEASAAALKQLEEIAAITSVRAVNLN